MNIIRLPCTASDNLNWKSVLEGISGQVFWQFDLGLDAPYFPLEDELHFQSIKLALSLFTKDVWPLYQEQTIGACLYKGSSDFSSFFCWSERLEENWTAWAAERSQTSESHLRRLFCANAFAHYFQMLAHALPDELATYLFFDTRGCGTNAEMLQLVSKERFEHFLVATQGIRGWDGLVWEEGKALRTGEGGSFAVCLPEEALCTGPILHKLDCLFDRLLSPFRVIPEPFLTELWEGVDFLYVFSEALSPQGKRKLLGFCAAGGTVIVEGDRIGLPQEISAKEFGAEGFEPPAYWSQTSRASQTALCPE